jgi:hypothetical protein
MKFCAGHLFGQDLLISAPFNDATWKDVKESIQLLLIQLFIFDHRKVSTLPSTVN